MYKGLIDIAKLAVELGFSCSFYEDEVSIECDPELAIVDGITYPQFPLVIREDDKRLPVLLESLQRIKRDRQLIAKICSYVCFKCIQSADLMELTLYYFNEIRDFTYEIYKPLPDNTRIELEHILWTLF